jgi:hypothetical protein
VKRSCINKESCIYQIVSNNSEIIYVTYRIPLSSLIILSLNLISYIVKGDLNKLVSESLSRIKGRLHLFLDNQQWWKTTKWMAGKWKSRYKFFIKNYNDLWWRVRDNGGSILNGMSISIHKWKPWWLQSRLS